MVHGADHAANGMQMVVTNRPSITFTQQCLERMGMSSQTARFYDRGANQLFALYGGVSFARGACGSLMGGGQNTVTYAGHSMPRVTAASMNATFLRHQQIAADIAGGHAFAKHVICQGEFPGWIRTRKQFTQHIEKILNNPDEIKKLKNQRIAYWDYNSGTVVIMNPNAIDKGTAFQPTEGFDYFEKRLK